MTPLDADDFHRLSRVLDVAVSPDGERVAVVRRDADPEEDEFVRSLFVVPADGDDPPHRLTRASDARDPAWSPDGSRLAFVASRGTDRADAAARTEEEADDALDTGAEEPTAQVWAFDLDRGGDARRLTDFVEGVRSFDWSPDGERLVAAARDPTGAEADALRARREERGPFDTRRTQFKADGTGYLDDVTTHLFVVDRETGATTRLEDAYGAGASEAHSGLQPSWGPGGIAFLSRRGPDADATRGMDLYVVAPDGGDAERLTPGEPTVGVASPRWGPDGESVAVAGSDPTNVHVPTEAWVVDADTGERRSASASLDRTLSRSGAPEWVDGDRLLAPVGDGGLTRLVALDAGADDPERAFAAQGRDRTVTAFDVAGGTVAVALSHPGDGEDVFAADAGAVLGDWTTADPDRLTAVNDDLLDGAVTPDCERVRFENGDGDEVEGLLYAPPGFDPGTDDPLPLVAHVHGGPVAYDAPRFEFLYAHWVGRGYAVLNVNYRGSSSYGRAFSEAIRGEWGPREADDVLSGVDAAVERGWADPGRLFVSGFSQGGINTLYVLTRDDRFRAAAPEHGIYDFESLYGTGDLHLWYEHDVGFPWEQPEGYRDISSIRDVDAVDTPLLVTAGENDWRCPASQAEQLYLRVKRRGVDARLVVYPDESHDVSRPGRAVHRVETLTGWFDDHGGGSDAGDAD